MPILQTLWRHLTTFWLAIITTWFYLPQGKTRAIRRVTGLVAIPSGFIVWFLGRIAAGTPQVPAWRWQDHLITLPTPRSSAEPYIAAFYVTACICLTIGIRPRLCALTAAIIFGYYYSLDINCGSNIFQTILCLLLALTFYNPTGPSCTRRLIQIYLTTCYGFSALQKLLTPDFVHGYSLQYILNMPTILNEPWSLFLSNVQIGLPVWSTFSQILIAAEGFFCFGLWFRRTRNIGLLLAFLFHLGIAIFFNILISLFSLLIWIGLLAFVSDGAPDEWWSEEEDVQTNIKAVFATASEKLSPPKPEGIFAVAFTAIMILIPLRIYFWPGRPVSILPNIDRTPWTFAMFIGQEKIKHTSLTYMDKNNKWHHLSVIGRADHAISDNELYAIVDKVLRDNSVAQRVVLQSTFVLNNHSTQTKTLTAERSNGTVRWQMEISHQ